MSEIRRLQFRSVEGSLELRQRLLYRSIKFPKAEQSAIFDRQLFGHLSRLMNGTLVQWNFVGV
jgi:hypothetical protein